MVVKRLRDDDGDGELKEKSQRSQNHVKGMSRVSNESSGILRSSLILLERMNLVCWDVACW